MKESSDSFEKEGENENEKNILKNYKILKKFEEKDLFLVSKNEKKICYNYLMKRIVVKSDKEKKEICQKIIKYYLEHFEESEDDKIVLFILMKVSKSSNIQRINEFEIKKEKDALIIFIRLVIELNSLLNKNIEYDLNPHLIFIDDKNYVKINLIDLALPEFIAKEDNIDKIDKIDKEKNKMKEDNEEEKENIKKNIEKEPDEIEKIKNKEKTLSLFLGLCFLDLFSKKKLLNFFSKNKDFLKLYFLEINDNLNQIKNEELKNLFSKLLCEENKRISLNELILEKGFLKKVVELNLINELIDSELNINIGFNSFPFFLSCNTCKIVPKIDIVDNLHVLFYCYKCHIFESEKIDNIIKLNSKWIKYFEQKSYFFNDSHESILNLYKNLLNEKYDFIKENINYIQSFEIDNNESRNIYNETIINILTIFFENIKFGKNIVKLNIIFMNTIDKDPNNINRDISGKVFFDQEEQDDNSNKKKEEPIRIKVESNFIMIKEKKSNNISFVDKRFNSSIEEQRDNFIILINQQNENQKKIIKNYVVNSFSNEYSKYNNKEIKKKKYIEDTIDLLRAVNHFVVIEKRKNPNNFIDINKTLEDFDNYSSTLNSKKHGEFILALLGKFLEQNGTKVNILKQKVKEL